MQASRSPRLHEIEGRRQQLDYRYVLVDFDVLGLDDSDLGETVAMTRDLGFAGVNVTHPFKEAVLSNVDALSIDAEDIGAVNTVAFGDKAIGHNTDCWGFEESFRRGLDGAPIERVLLLGGGGAGRAVARALVNLGVKRLCLFDPDIHKAAAVAERINRFTGRSTVEIVAEAEPVAARSDGIVNATPVGMDKYPGMPISQACLAARPWVADIVYFPQETQLVATAERLGCRTLRGSGMAVLQAVRAFEIFSGRKADVDAMFKSFEMAAPQPSKPAVAG